jgi:hypothetical protein
MAPRVGNKRTRPIAMVIRRGPAHRIVFVLTWILAIGSLVASGIVVPIASDFGDYAVYLLWAPRIGFAFQILITGICIKHNRAYSAVPCALGYWLCVVVLFSLWFVQLTTGLQEAR